MVAVLTSYGSHSVIWRQSRHVANLVTCALMAFHNSMVEVTPRRVACLATYSATMQISRQHFFQTRIDPNRLFVTFVAIPTIYGQKEACMARSYSRLVFTPSRSHVPIDLSYVARHTRGKGDKITMITSSLSVRNTRD